MTEIEKDIFIQEPGASFELERDKETDADPEKTFHNVGPEIIDARKAKQTLKNQEEAWERKRKMQEGEALAIEQLQKDLEEYPVYVEDDIDHYKKEWELPKKELLGLRPKRAWDDFSKSFVKVFKKYLPF